MSATTFKVGDLVRDVNNNRYRLISRMPGTAIGQKYSQWEIEGVGLSIRRGYATSNLIFRCSNLESTLLAPLTDLLD